MESARPDVHYHLIAVDSMVERDYNWYTQQLDRLVNLCAEGRVAPIPVNCFPVTRSQEAFRFLQKAKHVGKVVINFPHLLSGISPPALLHSGGDTFTTESLSELSSSHLRHQGMLHEIVMLTGGSGALGSVVVENLIYDQGMRHIVVLSRSGRNPADLLLDGQQHEETQQRWKRISDSQAKVDFVKCDVSDPGDVQNVFHKYFGDSGGHTKPILGGVIHAAGVLEDAVIRHMTTEQFHAVLRAKVDCLPVFDAMLEKYKLEERLKFFVLFSSVSSMLGNAGQANYATANAILDAFATKRKRQGKVCSAIQWGPWTEQGMAANLVSVLPKIGFKGISNALGLRVLNAAITHQSDFDVLGVETVRWKQYLSMYDCVPNLFAEVATDVSGNKELDKLSRELLKMSPEALHDHVYSVVINTAVEVTGRKVEDGLDLDQPITESGIDSLAAVEFGNELSSKLGVKLSPTTLFDYPTLNGIAAYVYERIISSMAVNSEDPTSTGAAVELLEGDDGGLVMGPDQSPLADRPISKRLVYKPAQLAIVGASCRMPTNSWYLSSFWDMMLNKTDCISYVPESRFDVSVFYDENPMSGNRCYVREAGFMEGVHLFDHKFFNISSAEVAVMDPQQRIFLEVAYECLLDARFNRKSVAGKCVGVYVGCCNFDWHCTEATSRCDSTFSSTGIAASIIANRVSYALGLIGPSLVVDTACSSSLVALEAAINHITIDDTLEGAIVGGVNVIAAPHVFVAFCKTRMLAPDGRCKTFDVAANGYGRGEGCGAVLVMPLKKAKGRRVHAIIRGAAVNHDGKSASLTAPNGRAQRACLASTLARSGVSVSDVVYLECHGTGTALGDPIECSAIRAIYLDGVRSEAAGTSACPLVLGALKTNIGHLEGAAGIAGLLKGILVLKNRLAPPLVHFSKLNPHIKFDGVKVSIPTEIADLELMTNRLGRSNPRFYAAVSSFGFGGANAHIILEEPSLRMASWSSDFAPDRLRAKNAGVVFLFTGQGAQFMGMGRKLWEADQGFRTTVDRVLGLFGDMKEPVKTAWLGGAGDDGAINQTAIAQIALFTLEIALMELLRSKGVKPQFVVGHSLGEYPAAVAAGAITLEDAALIVKHRALFMGAVEAENPVMCAVRMSEDEASEAIKLSGKTSVAVASINGPRSIVLSGIRPEVEAVLQILQQPLSKTRFLTVSTAFHSPIMRPARDRLHDFVASLPLMPAEAPDPAAFISTVTGKRTAINVLLSPEYWADQIVKPVRFADAVCSAAELGGCLFVEVGPKPTLMNMGKLALLTEEAGIVQWVSTLNPEQDDAASVENVVSLVKGEETHCWNHVSLPWEPVSNEHEEQQQRICAPPKRNSEGVPSMSRVEASLTVHQVVLKAAAQTFPSASSTDFDAPIAEALAGVDSLSAVEFREKLNEGLGIDIPVTILFDHACFKDMETHLVDELLSQQVDDRSALSPGPSFNLDPRKIEDISIAIVGVGCSFPKKARNPSDLWESLCEGIPVFEPIPLSRYNYALNFGAEMSKLTTSQTYSYHAALVDDPGVTFPCQFFHAQPREIANVDPQQRLAVRCAYEAFLRFGNCDLKRLYQADCGVFAACSDQEWQLVSAVNSDQTLSDINSWRFTGAAQCMLANRISHMLKLRGPSMTIDTGCSSFVSALSLACDALLRNRTELCLALGVSLILTPVTAIGFSQMRYLSTENHINVFDAGCSGTLRGEGCGAFILKRLREALKDGDRLFACIKAVSTNASGGAPSLTAFHTPSHEMVMRQALHMARVNPNDIDFVEAHGTGIPIGDAVEFSALKLVFAKSRWDDDVYKQLPLVITSPHPYLGHSNGALGAAQLLKAILSIRHCQVPALLCFKKPHPFFDLKKFPVEFAAHGPIKLRRGGRPLLALINSFGMGGANGCMVVAAPTVNTVDDSVWGPLTDCSYTCAALDKFPWTSPDAILALANVHRETPGRDLSRLKEAFDQAEMDAVDRPRLRGWLVEVDRSPSLVEYRHLILPQTTKPTPMLQEVIFSLFQDRYQATVTVAVRSDEHLEAWKKIHCEADIVPINLAMENLCSQPSFRDHYYHSVIVVPNSEFLGVPYSECRQFVEFLLRLAPVVNPARELILLSSVFTAKHELFKCHRRAGIDTYDPERWDMLTSTASPQMFGGLWICIVLEELFAHLAHQQGRRVNIVRQGVPLDESPPLNIIKAMAETTLSKNIICDGCDWLVTDRTITAKSLITHIPEDWDPSTMTGFCIRIAASNIPYSRRRLIRDLRRYGMQPRLVAFDEFLRVAQPQSNEIEALSQLVHRMLSSWFLSAPSLKTPNLKHVTLPVISDRPVTLRVTTGDTKSLVELPTTSTERGFSEQFSASAVIATFQEMETLPKEVCLSTKGIRIVNLLMDGALAASLSFAGKIAFRPWMGYVLQNTSLVEYLLTAPIDIPDLHKDPIFVVGSDRLANMLVADMLRSDEEHFTSVSFQETLVPFGPLGALDWQYNTSGALDLKASLEMLLTSVMLQETTHYVQDQLLSVHAIVGEEFRCLFPPDPNGFWEDTLTLEMLGLAPSYLMKFQIDHGNFVAAHLDYSWHRMLLRLILYKREMITGLRDTRQLVLTSPYHLLGLESLTTAYPHSQIIYVPSSNQAPLWLAVELSKKFQRKFRSDFVLAALKESQAQLMALQTRQSRPILKILFADNRLFVVDKSQMTTRYKEILATIRHFLGFRKPTALPTSFFEYTFKLLLDQLLPGDSADSSRVKLVGKFISTSADIPKLPVSPSALKFAGVPSSRQEWQGLMRVCLRKNVTSSALSSIRHWVAFDAGKHELDPRVVYRQLIEQEVPNLIEARTLPRSAPLDSVLITGAAGFFGRYLLHRLITSQDDIYSTLKILCIIRPKDGMTGRQTLERAFKHASLDVPILDRVEVIEGDLERQNFALSQKIYDQLASRVAMVFHAAGQVEMLSDFHQVYGGNVLTTLEVLKFIARARRPRVFFVSSQAAIPGGLAGGSPHLDLYREDAVPQCMLDIPNFEVKGNGYAWAKQMCETMMRQASELLGFELAIFRLPHIFFAHDPPAINFKDGMTHIIQTGLQLGMISERNVDLMDTVATEDVATLMIEIARHPDATRVSSLSEDSIHNAYHLCRGNHPSQFLNMDDIQAIARVMGVSLKIADETEINEAAIRCNINLHGYAVYHFASDRLPTVQEAITSGIYEMPTSYPLANTKRLQINFPWKATAMVWGAAVKFLALQKSIPDTSKILSLREEDIMETGLLSLKQRYESRGLSFSMDQSLSKTKLHNENWGLEPLEIFRRDVHKQPLTALGKLFAKKMIQQWYCNLLFLEDVEKERPDILQQNIVANPVFIVGLNRSGTTFLYHAMACDRSVFRAPLLMELMLPFGIDCSYDVPLKPVPKEIDPMLDPRKRECDLHLQLASIPGWGLIHQSQSHLPEEDYLIFDYSGRSFSFPLAYEAPSYLEWLTKNDYANLRDGYLTHKRFLKHLQAQRETPRWLIKGPWHMLTMDSLFSTYPDAKVLCLQRDPVPAVHSWLNLVYAFRSSLSEDQSHVKWVLNETQREADMVRRLRSFREENPELAAERILDVDFEEMTKDPKRIIRKVYAFLGEHYTSQQDLKLDEYLCTDAEWRQESSRREKKSLEFFGLSDKSVRALFA
eukprot:Gregarina_sp_Poly_1__11129@NODE_8_length_24379_cov_62_925633_g7_i0_p2_GENE_NODE_8_length_24379_cov_62_925633_g7_i0NODE_8_length_24379_cov_62_925633_g7_i0_p2_ORF_typecomplete_len3635_score538_36ketoacylsynt/PF00109_26/4_3e73ketoacylsynt/PF00109_26/4_8e60Acyl_transf_1/PF00698_21/2e79Ketoacylsynt_C/PF02801_22/5_4e03Ketoacylsynt_C/PF02801_22/3_2e37Ketoacylsynt_C/PF02801_22/1_8e27KR/PF08659_10/2_6e52KR/PF08659_10/1_9e03KR/PF08659_10/0_05NAD_binding_4/PF07993_12/8_1e05NAD_binding_4/PF07993_12/5_4e03NA